MRSSSSTGIEGKAMATVAQPRATLDDLYRTEGKAELIGGRIVHLMPTGYAPNLIAGNISARWREYAKKSGKGAGFYHQMGFASTDVPSCRGPCSPDAAC